jgi:hypothetical protein
VSLSASPCAGSGPELTLLAFLTTTCAPCAPFWERLAASPPGRDRGIRLAVVTPSPSMEDESEARRLTPPGVVLHMASETWFAYGAGRAGTVALVRTLPGSPPAWEQVGEVIGSAVPDSPAEIDDLIASWARRADS